MNWFRKIIIGFFALILLIIVLDMGLNLWIKYQFPKIINEKNHSPYFITYKKLDISLLHNTIKADEIIIVPKAALKDTLAKAGIYTKIKSVEVTDFKIWPVVFSDNIKARSIIINRPQVVFYKKDDKAINNSRSIRSAVVAPFRKIISVSDVFLNHGDIKIVYIKNNKAILSAQNINMKLESIVITDSILEQKIPFSYKKYAFSCDSVYYRPSEFYHIRTKRIATTNTGLKVGYFEMIPEYSRPEFVRRIPKEKDLYTLFSESIIIKKMDWGFKSDDFFFHADEVALDNVAANIYRSKMPPDDLTKKKLYNKLLRGLKFDLKVNTLKVRHSIVEYEEEKSFDKGAGKLTFSQFNLTAKNISSGFKKQKLADLKIKIKCRFMDASPLDVNWTLNVMDKSDGFNINGTILNFDAEKIVPFTKPYMNVTTKGTLDEVHFNFTGNDQSDAGQFAVKYDGLKFTVYKKDDRKKKNKLLSLVANIFVKDNTKDKVKEVHVELERIPEKSFYNFLWSSIAEGLKKILI